MRLVENRSAAQLSLVGEVVDPELVQQLWLEEYIVSLRSRGYSPRTIDGVSGSLDRALARCPVFVWELTAEVIDAMLAELTSSGLATSTKRSHLRNVVGFHRFVRTRKAAEVEARFGVAMVDPVDEFNSIVHVSDEGGARRVPPTVARLDGFFDVLRDRVNTARKYAPSGSGLRVVPDPVLDWASLSGSRRSRCR